MQLSMAQKLELTRQNEYDFCNKRIHISYHQQKKFFVELSN